MKKFVMVLVMMSLLIGLSACGSGDDDEGKTSYRPMIVNQI